MKIKLVFSNREIELAPEEVQELLDVVQKLTRPGLPDLPRMEPRRDIPYVVPYPVLPAAPPFSHNPIWG